jgi:hypothetical protein
MSVAFLFRKHLRKSSRMPKVIARKLDLPTLWVDTAIGIKLAKVQKGEAIH